MNQNHRTQTDNPLTSQGLSYDADGNLVEYYVAGDVNCDGATNFSDVNAFTAAIVSTWPNCATAYNNLAPDCDCFQGDFNGDGVVNFTDIDLFVEAIPSSGLWQAYTWDAENRLIGVEPLAPSASTKKVAFAYDYRGRRVAKKVYNWDTNAAAWETEPALVSKYLWDGWRLLLEVDGLIEGVVVPTMIRKYTWGLDLAGQRGPQNPDRQGAGLLEGAGGTLDNPLDRQGQVGGLLAVQQLASDDGTGQTVPIGRFVLFYDTNGNVGQVINLTATDAASSIKAHYEYDPYGTATTATGDYAPFNPWRFSTKQFDAETGLGYWGYRYYSPTLGRWVSRDPLEELGGMNLYAYVYEDPIVYYDARGRCVAGLGGLAGCQGEFGGPRGPTRYPEPDGPRMRSGHGLGMSAYCGCQDELRRQRVWNNKLMRIYGVCGFTLGPGLCPVNRTGGDIERCVDEALNKEGIRTVPAGTTDADGNVKVAKREGKCADLLEAETTAHEEAHRQHTLDLLRRYGRYDPTTGRYEHTDLSLAVWNSAEEWWMDELRAYAAGNALLDAMIAELDRICGG